LAMSLEIQQIKILKINNQTPFPHASFLCLAFQLYTLLGGCTSSTGSGIHKFICKVWYPNCTGPSETMCLRRAQSFQKSPKCPSHQPL
jgi:hypothetical protein